MINIGIIGLGFMGVTHFKAAREVCGARVAAVCTRDKQKLAGDWRGVQGNFGEGGGEHDLSDLAQYEDWRDLIADDSLDLVDICLPTHLHREVTTAALEAGKHVLVEKPLALTLEEADAMIEVARRADRFLMVGQVLRFFPAFAEARELVQSGQFGALRAAHFKRIISAPNWSKENLFADAEKSGGAAIDLHIHDTDFVHYLAGVPQSVRASGVILPNGAVTYLQTQYLYPNGAPCITCASGAIAASGLSFEHGFDIYLEGATLQYNNLYTGEDLWIYAEGEKRVLRPQRPDGFVAQLQHAADCVAAGEKSKIIDGEIARQALAVCLLEAQAVKSGKEVPM